MKKSIIVALSFLLLLGGCSSSGKKEESFDDAEVFYGKMVTFYDEYGNRDNFYFARLQDLVETRIYIKEGLFKLEWYEGSELKQSLTGTLDNESGEKLHHYDAHIKDQDTEAVISLSLENDKIEIYGECRGVKTYLTVIGGSVTIPAVDAKYIEMK